MEMKAKRMWWLALSLVLGAGLGLLILALPGGQARADDPGKAALQGVSLQAVTGAPSMFAVDAPFDTGPLDLSGSSVEIDACYQAGKTQTFCFTVYNGSLNGEWIDSITLTLPEDTAQGFDPWDVLGCTYEDPTDSQGYPVNFTCTPSGKQVFYTDTDGDGYGEITHGASWMACVEVDVPAEYSIGGLYDIQWVLEGDEIGGSPENGDVEMEPCTPLTLKPSQVVITGCNATAQSLDFELTNYDAGDVDIHLSYESPAAEFTGPSDFHLNVGEAVTFTTEFTPWPCIEPGETVVGMVVAESAGGSDSSFVTQSIAESGGWHRRADSPVPTMDNVVVWASHADGGLWSIGGYGSDGAVQRYDPGSDTWQTGFESEAVVTPLIEYPMDGCYGLNGTGEEIIILFPDTIVTGSLHVYNLAQDAWSTLPTPTGYPVEGRWGHDVVSMLQHTDENVCYLSGGSTQTGGGRTRDLWEYHPDTNTVVYRGPFPASVWFGFHASWYVPWVGSTGAICVAGGVDHNHQINTHSQCFDLDTRTFNAVDGDLGVLPEPWWGMADGWQVTDEGYEIWIANGVAQDGTLLPVSAYFREGMSPAAGFQYGPPIPHGMYRLEGDGWDGQFFTLNGSRGGFWYSEFSLRLLSCPGCHQVFSPLTLRNH